MAYAWAAWARRLGRSPLLALYWRRFNFWGAVASIITGTVVSSIWGPLRRSRWAMGHSARHARLTAGAAGAVAVTLLTARPSEEVVELFDRTMAGEEAA